MDSSTANAIKAVASYYSTPIGIAPVVQNASQGDTTGAAIGSLQTLAGLVQMFGKDLPGGNLVNAAAFAYDVNNAKNDFVANGIITDKDIYALGSDVATILSTVAVVDSHIIPAKVL